MIHLLANLFRGLSFVFGISAPTPEQDQRRFVFMWLGIILFLLGFAALLWYGMLHVRVR
jgi:nucleoside permease NupC